MRLGSIAVVGTSVEGLNLAEAMAASERLGTVTVFGREAEAPAHTVFARGLARYVFGLEPFDPGTYAVLLAVPDEVMLETAFSISGQGRAPDGCAAFHLSPTLPTDALAPLHSQGYALGVFQVLSRGFVAITGAPSAIGAARRIADGLDAEVLEVPAGRRPLVDAAAVMVSGALEPVIALSTRLMERAGIAVEEAEPALMAVAQETLSKLREGEERSELSAHPARRGDLERLSLHLRALDEEDQRLYAVLASEMVRIEGGGADAATRAAIGELLGRYLEPAGAGPADGGGSPDEEPNPQPTSVA